MFYHSENKCQNIFQRSGKCYQKFSTIGMIP
jgi:hypothetical protein